MPGAVVVAHVRLKTALICRSRAVVTSRRTGHRRQRDTDSRIGPPGYVPGVPVLSYRTPVPVRIYQVVFLLLFLGLVTRSAITGPGAVVVSVAIGAFAVVLVWRGFRLAVLAYPDRLVVRNYYSTREIDRSAVWDFTTGGSPLNHFSYTVLALTDEEAVALDATAALLPGRLGSDTVRRRLEELRGWLADAGAAR